MAVLGIDEVLKLKENLERLFNAKLHLHDSCGGQYFSLEEKYNAEFEEYLSNYFNSKNLTVIFTDDKQGFYVKRKSNA